MKRCCSRVQDLFTQLETIGNDLTLLTSKQAELLDTVKETSEALPELITHAMQLNLDTARDVFLSPARESLDAGETNDFSHP